MTAVPAAARSRRPAPPRRRGGGPGRPRPAGRAARRSDRSGRSSRGAGGLSPIGSWSRSRPTSPTSSTFGWRASSRTSSPPTYPVAPMIPTRIAPRSALGVDPARGARHECRPVARGRLVGRRHSRMTIQLDCIVMQGVGSVARAAGVGRSIRRLDARFRPLANTDLLDANGRHIELPAAPNQLPAAPTSRDGCSADRPGGRSRHTLVTR